MQRLSPATQVNLNLLRIEELNAAGTPSATWLGEIPLKWRHQQIRQLRPTVGPAIDCDLFYVLPGKWLELQPMIAPNNMKVRYEAGCRIFVTVQATSVEGESNLLRVEIAWNGEWTEGTLQMRRHLVFREVPAD